MGGRGWEWQTEPPEGLCSLPSSLNGSGGGAAQQAFPSCIFSVLGFCVLKLLGRLESLCFEMQDDFYRENDQIPFNPWFRGEEAVFYHRGIV